MASAEHCYVSYCHSTALCTRAMLSNPALLSPQLPPSMRNQRRRDAPQAVLAAFELVPLGHGRQRTDLYLGVTVSTEHRPHSC